MTSTGRVRKSAAESHVVDFMAELAKYLIAAGISSTRFSAISRLAYFFAASDQARFSNDRVNQSAVAAMTGLTRIQVRRFAKQLRPKVQETRDRLELVLEGWATDPAFTTAQQTPRSLSIVGRGSSFSALARKYGGDLPPKSLLRELVRHGFVTQRAGQVSLKPGVARSRQEYRLRFVTRLLANLIRTEDPDPRMAMSSRGVNLEIHYPACSEKGRILVQRRAEEGLRNFLSGLEEIGRAAAMSSPPSTVRKRRVTRARVALVTEDLET